MNRSAAISFAGLVVAAAASAAPRPVNRIAAIVNDDIILMSDVEVQASADLARSQRTLLDLSPKERTRVEREALDSLIADKLLDSEVKTANIEIPDHDIDQAMEATKKQYNMDDAAFERELAKEGYSMSSYRDMMRRKMGQFELLRMKVSSKIRVSDEDVKAEYARRAKMDSAEEEVRVRQIFFRIPKEAKDDPAVKARAMDIAKRARAGENFVELCKKYSEGPSREDGGDLGYFRRGVMQAEVDRAVFGLKVGQVSDPVKSQWGYHVFMLVDRRKLPPPPFEQIRTELREKLLTEQQAQYTKSYVDELRRAASVDVKIADLRGPEDQHVATQ